MAGQQQTVVESSSGAEASAAMTGSTLTKGTTPPSQALVQSSQSLALATTKPSSSNLTVQTQYSKPLPGDRPIRPGGLPNPLTYTTFKPSSLPGDRPIAVSQLKTLQTDRPLPANRPIASNQPTDNGINTLIGYLD